jgi:hypothetical protein
MAQYGNTETNETITQQLAASMDWCSANDYRGTPVTLLDSYQVPRVYDTKDLKWLLANYENENVNKVT